jgi:hypothetical protein
VNVAGFIEAAAALSNYAKPANWNADPSRSCVMRQQSLPIWRPGQRNWPQPQSSAAPIAVADFSCFPIAHGERGGASIWLAGVMCRPPPPVDEICGRHSRGLDDKDAGLPVVPDRAQPGPQQSIGRGQFRSFDGALENAELMAEREDLKLQRRTAPQGSENSGESAS